MWELELIALEMNEGYVDAFKHLLTRVGSTTRQLHEHVTYD
jgi:hypothetical protein